MFNSGTKRTMEEQVFDSFFDSIRAQPTIYPTIQMHLPSFEHIAGVQSVREEQPREELQLWVCIWISRSI
jgi:hypothetical protein